MNMQGWFTIDANNSKPIGVITLNITKIHEEDCETLEKIWIELNSKL
jgi:hypothetical protein